jgi:polyhydroxyalkanoate synthase subunit PhaC
LSIPTTGFERRSLVDSLGAVVAEVARRPGHTAGSLRRLALATVDAARGRGGLAPDARDRRFADPAWAHNFLYRGLLGTYLAAEAELAAWLDGTEMSRVDRERTRFVLSSALDALAPSNLPINPAAIKQFIDTGGLSAVAGARHLLGDVRHNRGFPSQVNAEEFSVGGNVAATEGSVVFRNEVLELIQYAPSTGTVHARPLVIAPPQINKYYLFDLSPDKSIVRYARDNGFQVFAVSWRNPTAEQWDWDLATYLAALEEALEAACAITGSPDANLAGACAGGVTSVALAAWLAARDKPLVNALTLIVSVFDTSEDTTLLSTFAGGEMLAAAKRRAHVRGVLDGRDLAMMFKLLRPNDLIWTYWVNNYLLGLRPPAFDVLYWNNDTTRLPAALHGQLIDLYRDNPLATPGGVVIDGTPLDLGNVTADTFAVAGVTDHITSWEACYQSARRLGGAMEFTLSGTGHILSILNAPGNPKWAYRTNAELPASTAAWEAGASTVAGSWWPRWIEWLGDRSGDLITAPSVLGDDEHAPIEAAPGGYVRS